MNDPITTGEGGVAIQTKFKPGDVLRYMPREYHCREGIAFVRDDGTILDTFWASMGYYESYRPKDAELETAEVLFNVNDYEELDRYSKASRATWETYHPDDRGRISNQHNLQESLFIRRGATPDLGTQIANAQQRVEKAEAEARSAERSAERAREDLALLEQEAERGSL